MALLTPAGALWIDFLDVTVVVTLSMTVACLVFTKPPKVSDVKVTGSWIDNGCNGSGRMELNGGRAGVGSLAWRDAGGEA